MNKFSIILTSLFVLIQTSLFTSVNAKENNLALMFIDEWMQEGSKTCEEFDDGEFYLRFNPLQIIDVTNDGIEDYILHETSGLCDDSYSVFAGGTGGEHWRIYVNPKIDDFNFDNYINLFVRDWVLTTYENKTALYISEHGQVCDRAGYIGCNSTVSISSEGVKLLEGPIPSDLITSFSPNRNQITYSFNVNNSSQIFISNSDSSNEKQISQESGEYFNPTWSPLGDLIAFSKIEGGKSYIGVMDIDGQNERMIATEYKVDNPQWFEDGKKIIFDKTIEGESAKAHIIDISGYNERPYAND